MKLKLDDGNEALVNFKDDGFFMPKNSAEKEVIVNGLTFLEERAVEQQHYANDGGETEEAISRITQPKKTYRFEADEVLIKE